MESSQELKYICTRWLSVDPLADKYPGWSPYNYTLNNPLKYVDPDGREIQTETEEEANAAAEIINNAFSQHGIKNRKATVSSKTVKASWLSKLFGGKDKTVFNVNLEGSGDFTSNAEGTVSFEGQELNRSEIANGVFQALENVINSETVYPFHYTNDFNGRNVSTGLGGGFVDRSFGTVNGFYVSPHGGPSTNSTGNFFHEMIHLHSNTIPGINTSSYKPNMANLATTVMNPWKHFKRHQ